MRPDIERGRVPLKTPNNNYVVNRSAEAGEVPATRSAPHNRREVRNDIAPELFPQTTVSLVIPARNEARNLPHVLDRLPAGLSEVILVDGHSSDITKAIARDCRPDIRIITEPMSGKGHALRAGFEAATGEIIVAMDADGSMSPEEIPQYVYFLERGFDFVKGSRFVGGGGSLDITMLRRLGNRGLLGVANYVYGSHLTDLCYGFFGFRRQYLDHLDLRSTGFEIETELTIRAYVSGLRIAEVPSLELPRRTGHSNLRSFRDGQRVLRTLLGERKRQTVYPSNNLDDDAASSNRSSVNSSLPIRRIVDVATSD
jgi:glycosyltransferase involved in cell wall biosynthesis